MIDAVNSTWREALSSQANPPQGLLRLVSPTGAEARAVLATSSYSYGLRVDTHEFPMLGGYWQQPLNILPEKFSISCSLRGEDWPSKRNALVAVLKAKQSNDTPLTIYLPFYEPAGVLFEQGQESLDYRKHGEIRLQLSFSRVYEDAAGGVVLPDAGVALEEAQAAVDIAAALELEGATDTQGKLAQVKAVFLGALGLLQEAGQIVRMAEGYAAQVNSEISQVSADIDSLITAPSRLIHSVQSIAATIIAGVEAAPVTAEVEAQRLLRIFASWGLWEPESAARTANELKVKNSAVAVVRTVAVVGTAQMVGEQDPASITDARALYARVETLEGTLGNVSADLREALTRQRVALREQVRSKGWFNLAAEKIADIRTQLPTLKVAQELGLDETALRRQNDVPNAFFATGKLLYVQ